MNCARKPRHRSVCPTADSVTASSAAGLTGQFADNADPDGFHLSSPISAKDLLERLHHREVEPVEHLGCHAQTLMIDPLDLDQVGAVRTVAKEIQQALHRHLEHLTAHQAAFVADEQSLYLR